MAGPEIYPVQSQKPFLPTYILQEAVWGEGTCISVKAVRKAAYSEKNTLLVRSVFNNKRIVPFSEKASY